MARTVSQWVESLKSGAHVEESTTNEKDFVSSATIVIAARTITYSVTSDGKVEVTPQESPDDSSGNWVAIGLVQNASVSQAKQLAQIFEIGSKESYIVDGRTTVQASLARVMIEGDSLMKMCYPGGPTNTPAIGPSHTVGTVTKTFYINLADDFFSNPLDLSFWFYDGEGEPMGAFYLKGSRIQAHQITLASQQTVVLENVSLRASKVISLDAVV